MDNPWTPEEERKLRRLPREQEPPRELEGRVAEALRSRGLLGRRTASREQWMAAAAAVLVFMIGVAGGREWERRQNVAIETAQSNSYMLLLKETPMTVGANDAEMRSIVAEYAAWAREQQGAGRLTGGMKLRGRTGRVIASASPPASYEDDLGGFFIIRAESLDEASRIAESSPHYRRGGIIQIRQIER